MDETIRLGVTLMIVTLIASLALALTNYYTAPQIEMQSKIAVKESLNKVIDAESFEEKDRYYDAYDKDGNLIGKVLKVEANGYSSVISALVGVDLKDKITGVDIVSQQETPGLGANVEKESFLSQFIGKTRAGLKIRKDGGEIDAITGATISSRAITNAIGGVEQSPDSVTGASPTLYPEEQQMDSVTGASPVAKSNTTNPYGDERDDDYDEEDEREGDDYYGEDNHEREENYYEDEEEDN